MDEDSLQPKNCNVCIYAQDMGYVRDGKGNVDLSRPRLFQCRRFPPQFTIGAQNGVPTNTPQWPGMLAGHWCGEFVAGGPQPEAGSKQ